MDPHHIDPAWLDNAKIAFAAFCGGMVRLLFRPAASFIKTMWLLFGCVTCGYYATPVIVAWWQLDADYTGAVGALSGFIGLSFAEAALRGVDNINLREWLVQLITKKP